MNDDGGVLDRYASLVDDEAALRAACDRPLPSVVRVNTLAADADRVARAFDEEGTEYERVDWHDGLFRMADRSPGTTWPYAHGWVHGQEEVSCLPAMALDPDPETRVWDTCAAPGSKTTQLAALMADSGVLVGNDTSLGRLSALRHNAERLGVTNLVVDQQDARNYSLNGFDFEAFDATLVDAPCSCEGTIRKNPDAFDTWTLDHVHEVAGIQKGILRRAVQATRPGGTVVYSTCTFAPEENEAVLDHVLREEDCAIIEWDCPLESVDGVTEWQGEAFDPSVAKSIRIYPHPNDTGGFFLAKLRVGGEGTAPDGGADANAEVGA